MEAIKESWPRIAGLGCHADGSIGCVWIGLDEDARVLQVYEACMFRREVLPVVMEGINARGRFIPVAWCETDKEMVERLRDMGVNLLAEGLSEKMLPTQAREVWSMMRSKRFFVRRHLTEWREERNSFVAESEQDIEHEKYPLMTATICAVNDLRFAKRNTPPHGGKPLKPNLAIV